jgi:16S rRNA pseudouridine516 synthase
VPRRKKFNGGVKRIDQWLANLGYCSRSEARAWTDADRVVVKGRPEYDSGKRVPAEGVEIDGQPLDHPAGLLLLMNKPAEVVCSHDSREGKRVYDLLPERWSRRNPLVTTIGRLDRDTTGLLLLTDQTELVHRLTSPKHKVPKLYRATLDATASPEQQAAIAVTFASGQLMLAEENKPCLPAEASWIAPRTVEVVLTEGRYHQVRRMFASQGFTVLELERRSFGAVDLPADLALGSYIELPLDQRF